MNSGGPFPGTLYSWWKGSPVVVHSEKRPAYHNCIFADQPDVLDNKFLSLQISFYSRHDHHPQNPLSKLRKHLHRPPHRRHQLRETRPKSILSSQVSSHDRSNARQKQRQSYRTS